MLRVLVVLLVCMTVTGCGGGSHTEIPSYALADLQAAAEQVEIAGVEYVVDPNSQLSRDFMPGMNPPEGGPLVAWVWIRDAGGHVVPDDIEVKRVYVINGTEIWQSGMSSEGRSTSDGPKWATGTLADVIVLVRHWDHYYLVKLPDVPILRLD